MTNGPSFTEHPTRLRIRRAEGAWCLDGYDPATGAMSYPCWTYGDWTEAVEDAPAFWQRHMERSTS